MIRDVFTSTANICTLDRPCTDVVIDQYKKLVWLSVFSGSHQELISHKELEWFNILSDVMVVSEVSALICDQQSSQLPA